MRLIDADKLIEVFEEQDHYLWKLPDKENPHKRAKQGQLNWCINKTHEQPTVLNSMKLNIDSIESALLWVIYEQCVYGNKAYAKLLIHGQEAFDALNLKDECDMSEIEERLFKKGNLPHY